MRPWLAGGAIAIVSGRVGADTAELRLEGGSVPADAVVEKYQALECLARPFEVEVDFYTTDTGFEVDSLLKQSLLLHVTGTHVETRYFHGVVDRAEFVEVRHDLLYFRVRLVPALSALAYREDCRIFQDQTTVNVLQVIFGEAGFAAQIDWKLIGNYQPREYIVQYRETTLNFVQRLMEDEGVFYYFRHSAAGHRMVIADNENAFQLEDGTPGVKLTMTGTQGTSALDRFERTRTLRTTNVLLRDYDFEKPQLKPESTQTKPDGWPAVYYEYPGGFTKSVEGNRRATARMRELRRDADVCRGSSDAIGMRIGAPFVVEGMAEGCLQGEFVVTSLHSYGVQARHARADVAHGATQIRTYHNDFTAVPTGAPWAPPRLARKPRIRGIQTVVVAGPSTTQDQTIHCDSYGRIKVHFFWDRVGQEDDKATCWLRTTQAMMGSSMILPRVGWELSVAFLEGDPDRPFAIGRLYNGANAPPYGLPGAKADGSVKSMSSPGGAGHNEMKMADSGGSQGHGMSAQKDMNSTIGNNKTEKIAVDEKHAVTVNMTSSIGANETVIVGANQKVDVGAVQSQKIGGNQSITIGGADTTNATSNLIEHVGGKRSYTIGGMAFTMQNGIEHTISGNTKRQVGAIQLNASVGSISDNIVGGLNENAGAAKVILAKGNVGEKSASKNQTTLAAEVHLIKGSLQTSTTAGGYKRMVGGIHQWKVGGDIAIKGDKVIIVGATGQFTASGSSLKLGGGPVLVKGSTVSITAPIVTKIGGTKKLGPG
jgi:type VI secretion system secreted protein VgrG